MQVSINPSYHCNLRCDFCYLTPTQLGDKTRAPLTVIKQRLDALASVDCIDLYGGEIALLPKRYLSDLIDLCLSYTDDVNIITNLTKIVSGFKDPRVTISTSYDFSAREQSDRVLANIVALGRSVSILTLVSREVLNTPQEEIIQLFNSLPGVHSVELKPYSSNQNTDQDEVQHYEYEDFLLAWLSRTDTMQFECVNQAIVEDVLSSTRNAFSSNHIYITPTGEFAVLEFDENNREYFLPVTLNEYQEWVTAEAGRRPDACLTCSYNGRCLTEHHRHSHDGGCDGFIKVLERMED